MITPTTTSPDAFVACRTALLDCASAATDVSVLFRSSSAADFRAAARASLLCAHACTRALRLMTAARDEGDVGLWAELQIVARLCETFVADCHECELPSAALELWRASCLHVAAACEGALEALVEQPNRTH